jgi:hypothetical protein
MDVAGAQLCRQTVALPTEQQQRVITSGLEMAVARAVLLLAIHRIIGHNTFSFFSIGRQHPGQAIRYSLAEVNPVPGTKATQARPAINRHRP